jgi:hypothetical protein
MFSNFPLNRPTTMDTITFNVHTPNGSTLLHVRRPDVPILTVTIDPPITASTYTPHPPPPPHPSSPPPPYPFESFPSVLSPIAYTPPHLRGPVCPFPLPPCHTCTYTNWPERPMPSNYAYFPSPPSTTSSLRPDPVSERDSQVSLHFALKYLSAHTGSNVWGTIRQHLGKVHAEGRRSSVLDLGCGTGIFCYDLGGQEE